MINDKLIIHADVLQECFYDFCEENGLKTLKEGTQNQWNAALMYTNERIQEYINDLKNSDNSYDIEKVSDLCDLFIRYCLTYDKIPSVWSFSLLSGINQDLIYSWANESETYRNGYNRVLSSSHLTILKKLRVAREESLMSTLTSGKNPVGSLAILNHQYHWDTKGTEPTEHRHLLVKREKPIEIGNVGEEIPFPTYAGEEE